MSKEKSYDLSRSSPHGNGKALKEKKRKLKDFSAEPGSPDTENAPRLSKEERREKKRLKREKKEKEKALKEEGGEEEEAAAAAATAKAARKAKKAEKKRIKALQESNSTEGPLNKRTDASNQMGPPDNNPEEIREASSYTQDLSLTQLSQSKVDEFLAQNHISISHAGTLSYLRPILDFAHLPLIAATQPSPFASFKRPTPIQAASWPFLLSGRDVVGVAETGSGKTLAFGVPCVRHIKSSLSNKENRSGKRSPAHAVIVSPTRELAVQIHEQIERLAKSAGLKAVCVYGGVPKDSQREALKTAHIVVATPGRLNDLIQEGTADLSGVSYVVLDEADRMLDKGFEQEIKKIIDCTLPSASPRTAPTTDITQKKTRQTLMFTATWPPSVRELAATFMSEPVRINIGEDNPTGELRANTRIKQVVEVVETRAKEQRMLQLIKQYQSGKNAQDRILVFCLYKKEAQRVENFIRQRGFCVAGIHGDLSQDRRTKSLESFKNGETPLLVATDVAARGLDIPNVKVVLNVTFPLTVEDYVHRIGRTGRAGADGLAITLFTEQDKSQSGALINVLKAANQPVPEDLLKFGSTVKKKQHDTYGAFFKEDTGKKAEKIKFDD